MIQFWNRVEKRLGKRNIQILIAIFVMALVCGAMILEQKIMKRFNENIKAQHMEKTDGNPQKEDEQTGTGASSEKEAGSSEVEASIVPGQYPIMGESSIQTWQMVEYFNESGENYPADVLAKGGAPDIETFCRIYYEEAVQEGVRPEVAFAQTMKETGWLQYGGDAKITQYNFAGIGTTGGGVPGNSYPDVRTGVRAQIQHLKAYATTEELSGECVDNRYDYVTKGCAPYVEWLGQKENPQGYGWATGENYGYDIVKMIHDMWNTKIFIK